MKIKIKELLDLELKKVNCAEKSTIDDIPLNSYLAVEIICNIVKNLNGETVKREKSCRNCKILSSIVWPAPCSTCDDFSRWQRQD